MERAMKKNPIYIAVKKAMTQAVTPDTQIRVPKKVVVCIAAIICEKKGMMETFGTKTDIFLNLENKSSEYVQSSFLIKEPCTQDGYVFCESENTKYVIPKDKFFGGSRMLLDLLHKKKMTPAVTPDTQIRGPKKVVVCIAAIKCEKKRMMETFGTKTDIFLNYKILENKSSKYVQSSFLIKKPSYTQDGYVFCESENTKYVIPKDKFFDESKMLLDLLQNKK
jgi:hypothetical protein